MANLLDILKKSRPDLTASAESTITARTSTKDPVLSARENVVKRIDENIEGLNAIESGKD